MEYHHLVLADRPAEGNTFRILYAESPEGWYELNLDTGVGQGYQIIQQVVGSDSDSSLTLLVKKMAEGWVPATVFSTNVITGTADGQLGEWMRRVEPFSAAVATATQAQVQQREQRPQQQRRAKGSRISNQTNSPVPLVQNPKQFVVPVQMAAPLQSPNCIPVQTKGPYRHEQHQHRKHKAHHTQQQPRCKIVI